MSWEILVKENIKELPVNIVELCHKLGIAVKYYDKLEQGNDGKCTVINKQPIILVRQECNRQRKRFTIAHELGHILLGHVGKYELVNREISRCRKCSDRPYIQKIQRRGKRSYSERVRVEQSGIFIM